jgi:recA bacterial DNA recombination protein
MSSAVVSTSAALGRPFLFDDDPPSEGAPLLAAVARSGKVPAHIEDLKKPVSKQSAVAAFVQSTIKNQQSTIPLTPASRLESRPAPEMAPSGIAALDSLTGGLPRGCLTEICGPASSGRTSVMLAAIAAATRRGEFCAILDASDALDPKSAATAGIDLDRFLWVRCGEDSPQKHQKTEQANAAPGRYRNAAPGALAGGRASRRTSNESEHRLDQVLRATDLLLESGGFGLIVLDLADLPPQSARRIPLTTWFRFRRTVEHKPTILLAIEQLPIAGSCSSLLLQLGAAERRKSAALGAAERRNSASLGAAERRQSAAHGASRGEVQIDTRQAPEGRKKIHSTDHTLTNAGTEPTPTHTHLLSGLNINIAMIRSRLDRKPAHSVTFETKTAWAG